MRRLPAIPLILLLWTVLSAVSCWGYYQYQMSALEAKFIRHSAGVQKAVEEKLQTADAVLEGFAALQHSVDSTDFMRDRLVRASIGVLVVCGLLFLWPGPAEIYDFLARPMMSSLPTGAKMIATGVISPFLVPMKVTLLVAFIVALPWVLYQVWAFVAPGLYLHEKKLVIPLVISSSLLFLIGIAFCYFLVFGRVFKFINEFAPASITVAPDIENYLDFVMSMCLAFGLTFEVPIVVIVLVRMGLVTLEKLKAIRPYVIVGSFVVAAIVTPPDVVSQFSLAVPMCLLYELGLLVAPVFSKATQAPPEEAPRA